MCGVAGFIGAEEQTGELKSLVTVMMDAVSHRGPDDADCWIDADRGVALGHRRLSVLDLSPLGRQPMVSPGGRLVITYNGEIYNYREIGRELESQGVRLRGRSDTEVLLAAVERWGLEAALEKLIGMFAFALWDREAATLRLVRDRLGIKPLYHARAGRTFLFGSELSAILSHPRFLRDLDREALTSYLRYGYVPAPRTVFSGCRKLEPGTILTVGLPDPGNPRIQVYWDARQVAAAAAGEGYGGDAASAVEELDALLSDAVKRRMISDVPLGAFLSGGVDSSAVVSLMLKQGSAPVRTFTIGNEDAAHDEAEDARRVANHLGCDHTELTLGSGTVLDAVAEMPGAYSEPFGDSSQVPTWLVSKLARQDVTVALSGDGGDELFAGYNRYLWGTRIWDRMAPVPAAVRRPLSFVLDALTPVALDPVYSYVGGMLPRSRRIRMPGEKIRKLSGVLRARDPGTLHLDLMSHWKDPVAAVIGGREPALPDAKEEGGLLERMMLRDLTGYLPDGILTKVDRASMQFGLEVRVPLLDHRVAEFAWRLPVHFKIHAGESKWILRRVLDRYVPRSLVDRGKTGFAVPVAAWLRGPLREWGEALLGDERLRRDGILVPDVIRRRWKEHVSGRRDHQGALWNVLMFQAWYERWGRAASSTREVREGARGQAAPDARGRSDS
jgi:asparagine synthase (glutamine-hydrolysing)